MHVSFAIFNVMENLESLEELEGTKHSLRHASSSTDGWWPVLVKATPTPKLKLSSSACMYIITKWTNNHNRARARGSSRPLINYTSRAPPTETDLVVVYAGTGPLAGIRWQQVLALSLRWAGWHRTHGLLSERGGDRSARTVESRGNHACWLLRPALFGRI